MNHDGSVTPRTTLAAGVLARARPRIVWRLLALAALLQGGCSSDQATNLERRYALTGRLQLQGRLFAADGTPAGVRRIHDADTVRVYLSSDGGALVDSTLTVDGAYGFSVLLGNYLAYAQVAPGIADSTPPLHVHDADRVFADTLRLTGTSNLSAAPNPFTTQIRIEFSLPVQTEVDLVVRRPSGTWVRRILRRTDPAGSHAVIWDGRDDAGDPVPTGTYWILLHRDGLTQAELAFKEP